MRTQEAAPRLAPGRRVYAIGDVHGRLDLLERMIDTILADNAQRSASQATMMLLGDFVDRGPETRRIISMLKQVCPWSDGLIVLKGNHEDSMVKAWGGDAGSIRLWLNHGGEETLKSYGVSRLNPRSNLREIHGILESAIPSDDIEWLAELPVSYRCGDYLFVHAGIRPGVELEDQSEKDQLWIRDLFLKSKVDHGFVVVHGHSVVAGGPEIFDNRINVDTGAYKTGKLSAVGLDGAEQWLLTVSG